MELPFETLVHDTSIQFGTAWPVIVWVFVLGAAIGSFLNVVAFRLPRGMSLNRPGSQCPACGHPIRWYDNVPIFGWLMLGGRCRDCKATISPRYPIVELLVAAASGLLAWSEITTVDGPEGVETFTLNPVLLGFRLLVVYILFCATILEFDGSRAPQRSLIVVLLAGVILSMISIKVLLAAIVLGLLAWPLLIHRDTISNAAARVAELALAGCVVSFTDWEAVAVFAQLAFLITRVAGGQWPPVARFGWAAAVLVGTLVFVVAAPDPAVHRLLQGYNPTLTFVIVGAIVAVLSIVGRLGIGGRPTTEETQ